MCQLKLQKKLDRMSLAGNRLSWFLKLWHIEEAHIPPGIPKYKNVCAFLKKVTPKKASQSLTSHIHLISECSLDVDRISTYR